MNMSSANPSGGPPPAAAAPSRRHPVYRGIRSRRGKWGADIREPGKKNSRIWLGTYPTPEMAAAAYDAASLAINWPNAVLNFPEYASTYPIPASLSAADIQVAAATAAAAYRELADAPALNQGLGAGEPPDAPADQSLESAPDEFHQYYVDEEEIFGMPSLLADMAQGMLMSPPRTIPDAYGSTQNDEWGSLWSYE